MNYPILWVCASGYTRVNGICSKAWFYDEDYFHLILSSSHNSHNRKELYSDFIHFLINIHISQDNHLNQSQNCSSPSCQGYWNTCLRIPNVFAICHHHVQQPTPSVILLPPAESVCTLLQPSYPLLPIFAPPWTSKIRRVCHRGLPNTQGFVLHFASSEP